MANIFNKLFKNTILTSVGIITLTMLITLLYLVPYLSIEQSKRDAFDESKRLINYIKIFRSYYSENILEKINNHSDLKVNYDHKTKDDTVPLPATLVHDLGEIFTQKTDTSFEMYSNYPFPNRKDRVLDTFQQEALAFVLKNPTKPFSKKSEINGVTVLRTAFADPLFTPSCVKCHNNRLDSPKDDWKLGDIRGVIEVTIPLNTSVSSTKNLAYIAITFILMNFAILSLYYFLHLRKKNKKLKNDYSNKDKLLSEYKKAVDAGAIVSKADKKGIITYVNDAFIDISGYSKDELIGKPHNIVRHPDTPKEVFDGMWEKLLNKQVWKGDIKNRKKDGSDYNVYATIVPILDEYDDIVEYLAIRYDTTNLHKAIEQANIAEKTKGIFLATMSHELRTPLNAIIGFSQILQRKNSLSQKDRDYIDKIHISGQNLLTLVNSILDFSKIEDGKMEFNPSQIKISKVFTETMVLIESQAKEKNITFSLDGFDTEENIFADMQLLKQAMLNILSNAVKFTNKDGNISIKHEHKDSKHIFTICDDGIGISKEDIKELFKPFKQGSSAKDSLIKGTGLGLAITHKIITELHNGEIWVTSEENKGTCFFISL